MKFAHGRPRTIRRNNLVQRGNTRDALPIADPITRHLGSHLARSLDAQLELDAAQVKYNKTPVRNPYTHGEPTCPHQQRRRAVNNAIRTRLTNALSTILGPDGKPAR